MDWILSRKKNLFKIFNFWSKSRPAFSILVTSMMSFYASEIYYVSAGKLARREVMLVAR